MTQGGWDESRNKVERTSENKETKGAEAGIDVHVGIQRRGALECRIK